LGHPNLAADAATHESGLLAESADLKSTIFNGDIGLSDPHWQLAAPNDRYTHNLRHRNRATVVFCLRFVLAPSAIASSYNIVLQQGPQ